MSPEAKRIAIGEACGLSRDSLGPDFDKLPDYLNDLNAMHEAEEWLMSQLTLEQWNEHVGRLVTICGNHNPNPKYRIKTAGDHFCYAVHATAAQRAEAFLRTLNLWKE